MATIHLPSSLANYANQQREISIAAESLDQALQKLAEHFPQLKDHIMDKQFKLLLHVAVFIDGEQLDSTQNQNVSLKADSQIVLVLALSGG